MSKLTKNSRNNLRLSMSADEIKKALEIEDGCLDFGAGASIKDARAKLKHAGVVIRDNRGVVGKRDIRRSLKRGYLVSAVTRKSRMIKTVLRKI